MSDALSELTSPSTLGGASSPTDEQSGSGSSMEEMMRDFIEMVEMELQMLQSQMGSSDDASAGGSSGGGAQPAGLGGGADSGDASGGGGASGAGDASGGGDASGAGGATDAPPAYDASDSPPSYQQATGGDEGAGSSKLDQFMQAMVQISSGAMMAMEMMSKGSEAGDALPKPINATVEA